jgi:hypothetical protein
MNSGRPIDQQIADTPGIFSQRSPLGYNHVIVGRIETSFVGLDPARM